LSIFVDGDSGIIFFDEGAGPDRVGGGVLTPEGKPRFVPVLDSEAKDRIDHVDIEVEFSGRRLTIGRATRETVFDMAGDGVEPDELGLLVYRWVSLANALLDWKIEQLKRLSGKKSHDRIPAKRRKSRPRPKIV